MAHKKTQTYIGGKAVIIIAIFLLTSLCRTTSNAQQNIAETSCADMIDNDNDWSSDCWDDDCKDKSFCSTRETVCNDKFDNDGNGKVDCADPNCSAEKTCKAICGNNTIEYPEQCDDGKLNIDHWCDNNCKPETIACTDIERTHTDGNVISIKTPDSKRYLAMQKISRWDSNSWPKIPSTNISHTYTKKGEYKIEAQLSHIYTTNLNITCSKTVSIKEIPWCTDPYASNFNTESTTNNGSCLYDASPIIQCKDIEFKANKKNVQNKELTTLSRKTNEQINKAIVYPWEGENIITKNSSVGVRYNSSGKKEAILILITKSWFTTSCTTSITVWKIWCTVASADNYDPTAEINDGSCKVLVEKPHIQISSQKPYQTGDKTIETNIEHNGNKNRLKITVILSQNQQTKYTFTPKLQDDGSIKIPISFVQWELWYINPGNYEISIFAQHYKENKSDTKKFFSYIWPVEEKEVSEPTTKEWFCWNQITESTEECDSWRYCQQCIVEWLTQKEKKQIENIVNELIMKNSERTAKSLDKGEIQKIANNYKFDNNIQEFAINIFLKKVKETTQNIKK